MPSAGYKTCPKEAGICITFIEKAVHRKSRTKDTAGKHHALLILQHHGKTESLPLPGVKAPPASL